MHSVPRPGCAHAGDVGRIDAFWVTVKAVAQPLGQGHDPLAHRQARQDMIDQLGGSLGHPPGVARGADATAFAGEGDEEIVAAPIAPRSCKAIGQNAALQVGAQLALGVRRDALILPLIVAQSEEGLEVVLHRPVQRRVGGAPPAVDGRRAPLRLDGHVRIPTVDML